MATPGKTQPSPRHPAKHAGPTRRHLPLWIAGAAILGIGGPLLAFSPRPFDPATYEASLAEPWAAVAPRGDWHGLRPGMAMGDVRAMAVRGGYRLDIDTARGLVEAMPASGPCRNGWAPDRICERAVMQMLPDASGTPRLRTLTVEARLPEPRRAEDLLADIVARLGQPATRVAEESAPLSREQPMLRYGWVVGTSAGPAVVEVALPSLLLERVDRWRLVLTVPVPAAPAPRGGAIRGA